MRERRGRGRQENSALYVYECAYECVCVCVRERESEFLCKRGGVWLMTSLSQTLIKISPRRPPSCQHWPHMHTHTHTYRTQRNTYTHTDKNTHNRRHIFQEGSLCIES